MLETPRMSNYYNNPYKIGLGENVMTADNQQGRTQEKKLLTYRVMDGRDDIPEKVYAKFEARDDDEAKRCFEKYKNKPSLAWDQLRLVRVDQVEKTTNIDYRK